MSETRPLSSLLSELRNFLADEIEWHDHWAESRATNLAHEIDAALAREQPPSTDDFETFKRGWRQALAEVKAAGEDSNGIADLKLQLDAREHQLKAALARLAPPALPASVEEAKTNLNSATEDYAVGYGGPHHGTRLRVMLEHRDTLIARVQQPLLAEIEKLKNLSIFHDQQLRDAAEEAGIPNFGCDTPQWLVDALLTARARAEALEAELAALKAEQASPTRNVSPSSSGIAGPQSAAPSSSSQHNDR